MGILETRKESELLGFVSKVEEVTAYQYANGEWKVVLPNGDVENMKDDAFRAKYDPKPGSKKDNGPEAVQEPEYKAGNMQDPSVVSKIDPQADAKKDGKVETEPEPKGLAGKEESKGDSKQDVKTGKKPAH